MDELIRIMRFKAEDMIYENFKIEIENVHCSLTNITEAVEP